MFENTISNIKIPSKVNTENLKSSSKEHINYIKRNKLILVPILISLVIMIIATFWIKSSALSSVGDELEYYDDETMVLAALLKPQLIEEMIYYDYDIEVDLPNFTSLPIMMGLIHNAGLDFNATVSAMGEEEGVKFSVNNLFTGLLLIPIIALIIGGIIYGRMAV
ncbi:Zinc ribbon domain-containing protein OS=Ureibacillus acetophenoni OX=614649 GN=SAMN05877842_10442 PE=4 SV=1 [Ureibacillus acetophenoni]